MSFWTARGLYRTSGIYYVCGSAVHRRGLGCGPGVYVPKDMIEADVRAGLEALLGVCSDPRGMTRKANAELRRIWEQSMGCDPNAAKRLTAIDAKIANIRRAIEDGLSDAAWANARLQELLAERERLLGSAPVSGKPPQIDAEIALALRRQTEAVLAEGTPAEKKRVLRTWVNEVTLAPESL